MLYPPYISENLPAQIGTKLQIPYELNITQGWQDVADKYLWAKIKTIPGNIEITTSPLITQVTTFNNIGTFGLKPNILTIGAFYKIQLGWSESDTEPPIEYSSVGIFKYTDLPQVNIIADTNKIATINVSYVPNASDPAEKLYSYQFIIYDSNDIIVEKSQLYYYSYRNQNNDANSQNFSYEIKYWDQNLRVECITTSINNLEQVNTLDSVNTIVDLNSDKLLFMANPEEGYIGIIAQASGTLYRSAIDEDIWYKLSDISQNGRYNDFTIEQGKLYKYALVQNGEAYIHSIAQSLDFEHLFLRDNKCQLKIKYNPKVSSFKTTLQESKIDTLGGRYPIFVRNGNLQYQEIGISGLISMHMDDQGLFLPKVVESNNARESTPTEKQIRPINTVYEERRFREKVLEWLNNGQPKLLRSDTEGNYLVRLMNVSATPEAQLGRMLYNFTATAYEIDGSDPGSLSKYNLLDSINVENREYESPINIQPTIVLTEFNEDKSIFFARGNASQEVNNNET